MENAIKQLDNASLLLHTCCHSDWSAALKGSDVERLLDVFVNPASKFHEEPDLLQFSAYIESLLPVSTSDALLQSSDVVGNIFFTCPVLYVFPGFQGDAALFAMKDFTMLIDGGFGRRACFWDFVRHLDSIDSLLVTHMAPHNLFGVQAFLDRKLTNQTCPSVNFLFMNCAKFGNGSKYDVGGGSLVMNLHREFGRVADKSRKLGLSPHPLVRPPAGKLEPINLFHKIGHGSLDMYVLNPVSYSKEMKEFLSQLGKNPFSNTNGTTFTGSCSVCILLVVRPANAFEKVTRILLPGSAPQHKIIEGFERMKHLDFLRCHVYCDQDYQKPKKGVSTSAHRQAGPSRHVTPFSVRPSSARASTLQNQDTKASTSRLVSAPTAPPTGASSVKKAAEKLDFTRKDKAKHVGGAENVHSSTVLSQQRLSDGTLSQSVDGCVVLSSSVAHVEGKDSVNKQLSAQSNQENNVEIPASVNGKPVSDGSIFSPGTSNVIGERLTAESFHGNDGCADVEQNQSQRIVQKVSKANKMDFESFLKKDNASVFFPSDELHPSDDNVIHESSSKPVESANVVNRCFSHAGETSVMKESPIFHEDVQPDCSEDVQYGSPVCSQEDVHCCDQICNTPMRAVVDHADDISISKTKRLSPEFQLVNVDKDSCSEKAATDTPSLSDELITHSSSEDALFDRNGDSKLEQNSGLPEHHEASPHREVSHGPQAYSCSGASILYSDALGVNTGSDYLSHIDNTLTFHRKSDCHELDGKNIVEDVHESLEKPGSESEHGHFQNPQLCPLDGGSVYSEQSIWDDANKPMFDYDDKPLAIDNALKQNIHYGITNGSTFQMGGIQEEDEEEMNKETKSYSILRPSCDVAEVEFCESISDEPCNDNDDGCYAFEKDVDLSAEEVHMPCVGIPVHDSSARTSQANTECCSTDCTSSEGQMSCLNENVVERDVTVVQVNNGQDQASDGLTVDRKEKYQSPTISGFPNITQASCHGEMKEASGASDVKLHDYDENGLSRNEGRYGGFTDADTPQFDVKATWGEPMGLPPPPLPSSSKESAINRSIDSPKGIETQNRKNSTNNTKSESVKSLASGSKSPVKSSDGIVPSSKTSRNKSESKNTLTEAARSGRLSSNTTRSSDTSRHDAKGRQASLPAMNTSRRLTIGGKSRASPDVARMPPLPPFSAFYVDLTYIPNHGDLNSVDVEFFRRVRARYYVFSARNPNPKVLELLLEAKSSWDRPDSAVTVIPTYETVIFQHWMAVHKDQLAESKVEIAPAASRCTVRLQDHEESCCTYRVDF